VLAEGQRLRADEVGLDVVGAELSRQAVGRERVLGAVAGGAAVADDERLGAVMARGVRPRAAGERGQEEERGKESRGVRICRIRAPGAPRGVI